MVENSTAGLVMVTAEVAVTVTREEHHQRVLARYAPAPDGERRVAVELTWCVIATGKYKGQHAIEVRLDGHRVGELTYAMSQRYAPLVTGVNERGGRAGCEAVVQRDAKGLQLTLRLPRDGSAVPAEEPPTVVVPAVVPAPAKAPESTFTKHRKAWVVAAAVAAVLFFAAIANNDDEPATSSPAADETTFTTTEPPTSTTTTTTTPPPPPPTTTTVVQQPPPPQTTEQQPAPPPPVAEEPAPQKECDPNYTGCVPISSDDVDCAGGSGNGPEYAEGPVDVIGSDIYGLDHDKDGVACE